MKVLITTGPTQEPIDDFRFITNASSGKMGAALAAEAMARGHDVTLVHGPVFIDLPKCKKIPVRTTDEMVTAVLSELKKNYDIFISAAAISDFSPKKVSGKIKSGSTLMLKLEPTPKLIDEVRAKYPHLFLVAFKAEYNLSKDALAELAKKFLKSKKLDAVIANDLQKHYFGADESEMLFVSPVSVKRLKKAKKQELAKEIWDALQRTKGH